MRRSDSFAEQRRHRQRAFVGQFRAANRRNLICRSCLQIIRDELQRFVPRRGQKLSAASNQRVGESLVVVDVIESETVAVRNPAFVDRFVVARNDARQSLVALRYENVGSAAVSHRNCGHVFQFPYASAETKIARCQCANRTNVNRVAGKMGVERRVAQRVDHRFRAARDEFENRILRDFILETRAARALNAAFAVERNQRRQRIIFVHVAPQMIHILHARLTARIRHRLILQHTFAALVAHRTIERMVREEEFEYSLAHLDDGGRFRKHDHAFRRLHRTQRLRLGHHRNRGRAVFVQRGRFVGIHLGHSHFAQTHATHSDRGKFRVIAKTRHVDAQLRRRFDNQSAFGNVEFLSVDGDSDQICHKNEPCCYFEYSMLLLPTAYLVFVCEPRA